MLLTKQQASKAQSKTRAISFHEWTKNRDITHYSTNSGSEAIAFQSWRNFKEAFAPELIGHAFEETSSALGRPVKSCIDPFGGSGTTALACQFLGVHPVTIEINPYLADLIEAKLGSYDTDMLIEDFERVLDKRGRKNSTNPYPYAPQTFVEPGIKGRFLFYHAVAQRLYEIYCRIMRLENERSKILLRVLLASIAVDCSNAVVSGKGRRYRKNWETRDLGVDDVDTLFTKAFLRATYEINRFQRRRSLSFELVRGDSRTSIPTRRRFDMAVFSPPYPNSFDYTDVYNIELWIAGYLKSFDDNRQLRNNTLRSHVQIKRQYESSPNIFASPTLISTYSKLVKQRGNLWNKDIPEMILAYFADMKTIMSKLSSCLRDDAHCYAVVGDSRYQSTLVPVGEILQEISESLSLKFISNTPFRSMRASPQQGGNPELVETLLTFKRTRR